MRAETEALLPAIRAAAEARWPGARINAGAEVYVRRWTASLIAGPQIRSASGIIGGKRHILSTHGTTEAAALERLLAEVRR